MEQPLRYRVEIGGTQSEWIPINVVRHIKLQKLSVEITPPVYTGRQKQSLVMTPEELEQTPISAAVGSRVDVAADLDLPVGGALLQANESEPVKMEMASAGRRFSASFQLMESTRLVIMPQQAGDVIARLPENGLTITCLPDGEPRIEMRWPTQPQQAIGLDQELKIQAVAKDD